MLLGTPKRGADPAGGLQTLGFTQLQATSTSPFGYEVTNTRKNTMTPTLDVTGYRVQSAEYETIETGDVSTKMTAPDGTVTTMSHLPEARWGTLAPMTTVKVESGGYTSEVAVTRTPSLATPGDPTSLQTLETDVTVDGDTWTTYLDLTKLTEATYFETRTSPELRTLLRLRRGRAPATVTGPAQVGLGP